MGIDRLVDSYLHSKHLLIFVNFIAHSVGLETSAIVGSFRKTFYLSNCKIHNKSFLRILAQAIRAYDMADLNKVATNFSEFFIAPQDFLIPFAHY